MTLHDKTLHARTRLTVHFRRAVPADADAVGRITFEAFRQFHESRGFAPDFPSVEAAIELASVQIADPNTFGIVATHAGTVVGANFLSEGDPIRGVGPIAVHPDHQDRGIARMLMDAVIDRGRDALGIRLLQDAFNAKSMALYTDLGFDAREPVALMTGTPRGKPPSEMQVLPMVPTDLPVAAQLSRKVHGVSRSVELQLALARGTPLVLEREGRLAGYMTMPSFWQMNHAVAEDDAAMRALILGAGAASDQPLGLLVPIRHAALFRWCLSQGLKVVKPMTLMSMGHYREPEGAWLPSVLY